MTKKAYLENRREVSHPYRVRGGAAVALGALLVALVVVAGERGAAASPLNDCHSSDNGDPALTSISLSPAVVDVRSASARVEITAAADDTGGPGPATGVRSVGVEMPDPGTGGFTEVSLARDASTGAWTGSLTIPRAARAGRLRISQAFVHDRAGQLSWYGPEDKALSSVSGTHVVTIRSIDSPVDKTAPALTAFSFNPHSVNTTRDVRQVVVTARAHDRQTGVQGVSAWFTGPRGGNSRFAALGPVPGARGWFRGTVTIDRFVPSGRWRVAGVGLVNGAGRVAWYRYVKLGRLGFDRVLAVRSIRDRWPATLHGVRGVPAAVDVRTQDQHVTVTARLRDRGAGIRWADVTFDRRSTPTIPLHLIAGTRNDGTWQGQMTVRRCRAVAGAWKITVSAMDRRGNYTFFSPRWLTGHGLPSTVHVTATRPATPPRVTTARYTIAPSGRVKLMFARAVNGLDAESAPVHEFSPDGQQHGAPVAGSWICRSRTGVVSSCAAGPVRTAVFRPGSPFTRDREYLVELNPEHVLRMTDYRGNPYDREALLFQVE